MVALAGVQYDVHNYVSSIVFALPNEPLLDATKSHTLTIKSFLFSHHQFKPNNFPAVQTNY